jgi:hypothetical protein
MFSGFAHSELCSMLWPVSAIPPIVLTPSTINTYNTAQGGASIDTWQSGKTLFRNMLMLIDVGEVSGSTTLDISLRDHDAALTNGNGDANSQPVATLTRISAAGLYYAEFIFTHTFDPAVSSARMDDGGDEFISVQRYMSVRATATTATSVTFGVICLFGMNSREFPTQSGTKLTITWDVTAT